ncbi:hypothetical protein [Enterococcus sp. BWR-S5]|uniref:hypothetical protein n=1 Tax=Enterococcus sp. BWR-S5 TaxID=2787714 RepID=UPI0019205EB9|nr:hypothetical protein [Enterococcus sp. BWR-S5]MBL1226586.1 hypothetical protein [Enterococcus sp. BWR-S5]
MNRRYSNEQKQAATVFFSSNNGIILEEEEKPSGNYVYQVKIDGLNKRFKIENDRLWLWRNWDWRPVYEATLPRLQDNISRLDKLRETILDQMEKAT